MKSRSVIKTAGGHAIISFDSNIDMMRARDMLSHINSPYSGHPLRYDRDGEKRLFVSSFGASTEITIPDYRMICRTLESSNFEVTDHAGIWRKHTECY